MNFLTKAIGYLSRLLLCVKAIIRPDLFGVTMVVTSCKRYDLLDLSLESFYKFNRFPLYQTIIVEDGPEPCASLKDKYHRQNIEWIATGERVGQIAAIDYAYSRVKTAFIFHMEDDWEFFRPGFISRSMVLLLKHPKCLQISLRAHNDINDYPIEPMVYRERDVVWRKLAGKFVNAWGEWNGFSFNPGLRRMSDYVLTSGYGSISEFDFDNPGSAESKISQFYAEKGHFAGIFDGHEGRGFVRHIGANRHVR